jgi:ubiquinone/menaquinone biosynthesis C-methylase UbiE
VTREDVRGYWDRAAARFDEEPDHGLRDPRVRAAWDRLLREHLPAPPADVLDLGCGTGSLTLLLAEVGHRVHGLDLAPAMVAAATAKLAAARASATVEVADASDPPGHSASYDVVLTRHVLWALPDPATALSRWVRLLRPGGRLLLVEGRWWTGGGLTSAETESLLVPYASSVRSVPLTDPDLWGGPVNDERYLVVAVPSS